MRALIALLTVLILLTACGPLSATTPQITASTISPTTATTATKPSPAASTATSSPTVPSTPTQTPTTTATNTPSPTPTIIPTYAILRGSVNVERASCRYGPGWMYLYLYGLLQTANQEIIGRTDTGEWLLTRAPGDPTVCWIKADLLDIQGDVMAVEMVYPDKFTLIVSPYYYPPVNVAATRSGNQVTITWDAESLRAGDEESPTSPLFVVETWVCRAGKLVFTPLAAWSENAVVADEPGCAEPSHGRVFLSEKHGYAGPSEIPWPPAAP